VVAVRGFPIRYSPRLLWMFVLLGLGPRWSRVELDDAWLTVRMGWAFRARIPRASIRRARRERDVWWAIGVHGDLRGGWLVNGSATGIVALEIDPPAAGRVIGVPVRLKRLGLGLEDPERFLEAHGATSS
jgi:hypothetical protein